MVYDALMSIRDNISVPKKGISSVGIGIEPPDPGFYPQYIGVEWIPASTMKKPREAQAWRGFSSSVELGSVAFFELGVDDVIVAFTLRIGFGPRSLPIRGPTGR